MHAVNVGPNGDIAGALQEQGVETTRVEGIATGDSLDDAGLAEAELLVITDVDEATAVPVARERNPDIRIVFYTTDTVPEFVRGQLDLAIDPDLLSPAVVAEELVGSQAA